MSAWLAAQAWSELLYLDLVALRGFPAIRRCVLRARPPTLTSSPDTAHAVVEATNTAIALYFKTTKCLQRSAAVTRLLRRHGVSADMVIGSQLPILKAHAWVEVAGTVVSDDLDGLEYFQVLDRW